MEQTKTSVGQGLVRHPDGAPGAGTKSDEGVSTVTPARENPLSAAMLPAVVGGLTGALCAVAAVLAILELRPPLDARLPALAQQVGGFQQELYALETAVRTAEVDVVRALDADRALSKRLDTQAASLEAAVTQVSEARQVLQVDSGPGSAIFSVAVSQLAGAVSLGGAFENEWVTLYALSRGNDEVRAALSRLMPLAAEGIPTVETLRDMLQTRASEAGVPIVDPSNLYSYGLNALQSGLGVPIGSTAEQQVVSGLVTAADRQLASGNVVSALEEMDKLTAKTAAPFANWLQQARRRALADAEVDKLAALSTQALRTRTRNDAG